MDIKTLIKKLDIPWAKAAFYGIFAPAKLYELALDKANTAVNLLLEANADTVQEVREKLFTINGYLKKYRHYLPEAWEPYYMACNETVSAVYVATGDNNVSLQERTEIFSKFALAYSAFKAD